MRKQMWVKEEESIEHSMINKALRHTHEKIEKKAVLYQNSTSREGWFKKNFSLGTLYQ